MNFFVESHLREKHWKCIIHESFSKNVACNSYVGPLKKTDIKDKGRPMPVKPFTKILKKK